MLPFPALICALVATVASAGVFVRGLVRIIRTVRAGSPTAGPSRWRPFWPRLTRVLTEVLGHGRFASLPWVRVAHWAVMISFPLLVLSLVTAYGQLVSALWVVPVFGHLAPWEWLTEAFIWLGLAGGVYLTIRRTRAQRADNGRFTGSIRWQARYVEFVIVGVLTCALVLRVLEYTLLSALGSPLASPLHFPLTFWLGGWVDGSNSAAITALGWAITGFAAAKIAISLSWFVVVGMTPSMGVAWHRFVALVNLYTRRYVDGRAPLGDLPPMLIGSTPLTPDRIEDLETLLEEATASSTSTATSDDDAAAEPVFGVNSMEQYPWKGLLDLASCTECGRCQTLCPAWNAGKPLSPKLFIMGAREHAFATVPFLKGRGASQATAPSGPPDLIQALVDRNAAGSAEAGTPVGWDTPLIGPILDPEVLWSCTTCGACVDQCPVDIEHIDHIINLRRNQVLMESAFPGQLAGMFRKLETKGNPWGMSARKRLEWAKGLDFEVPVVGVDVEDLSEVDYLFWVGCAGAFEDRAKATTRAVAELLHRAGVSFAVLGDGETCTGDPARRAGNEILFQMLAAQNIETLEAVGARKIVVTCAHCFNSLSREYASFGANYDVIHHSQLLATLIAEGALTAEGETAGEAVSEGAGKAVSEGAGETAGEAAGGAHKKPRVTYHDACYLGRHNGEYSAPRQVLAAIPGIDVAEMEHHGREGWCCGAGGAHAFMEEDVNTRVSSLRLDEAEAVEADVIATACPFCTQMLSSEARNIEIKDIALVLRDALK